MKSDWRTIWFCSCRRGTRHRFVRGGAQKGNPIFVAPCGRTMQLAKTPVGPWSDVSVPGVPKGLHIDDAFPLRLGDSTMPAYRPPEVVPNFNPPTGKVCPFCHSRGHWRICPIDPAFR